MKQKVMLIFGTRPEAIKMAPVILELKQHGAFQTVVCVTAQHRLMLDQVLDVFAIVPDYDLNVMKQGQSLSDITTRVIKGLEAVIQAEQPDMVLVHGDTTTSFAGALAAFYQKIPVGHVEAGLRTYDKYAPYPEEINRQLISAIVDLHFAPTQQSKNNLLAEGKDAKDILVTGNTAIDALNTTLRPDYQNEILDWVGGQKMLLLTAHRRENMGEPLRNIFAAMRQIVEEFNDIRVVYPVHKNPEISKLADAYFASCDHMKLIDPLGVADFHNMMAKSHLILTDSGGVQEEAPSLGVPVLVLRDKTERPEGIQCGVLKLVGTIREEIVENVRALMTDDALYKRMSKAQNPYGDGYASKRIVQSLYDFLCDKRGLESL